MTNKERYQRTFSALHASEDFLTEVNQMKHTAKNGKKRIGALSAAVAIIAVLATAAYAADVGGIRRTVQIWLHGDKTDAVLEVNQNADATTEYSLTYTDENGETHQSFGGGIAVEDGVERPLTEEEILEHLSDPEVFYNDNGTVTVFYLGQSIDITDKFDEDGLCYVQVKRDGKPLYLTIKYGGGYNMSPHGYEPYE